MDPKQTDRLSVSERQSVTQNYQNVSLFCSMKSSTDALEEVNVNFTHYYVK